MRLSVLVITCYGLVISLPIIERVVGQQDSKGPPRMITPPRPSVTAQGEGYTYTWCEYTPYMTCYDTTVSTAERPVDGPQRLAVPVPEKVSYTPLVAVLMFSVLTGLVGDIRDSNPATTDISSVPTTG